MLVPTLHCLVITASCAAPPQRVCSRLLQVCMPVRCLTVLVSAFQVLAFPEEQGHTIQNALIIQHNVERQVLVEQTDDAFRLIRQQSRQQGPAAAVINRCYTVQGDHVYARKQTVTIIPVNNTPRPRLQRCHSALPTFAGCSWHMHNVGWHFDLWPLAVHTRLVAYSFLCVYTTLATGFSTDRLGSRSSVLTYIGNHFPFA